MGVFWPNHIWYVQYMYCFFLEATLSQESITSSLNGGVVDRAEVTYITGDYVDWDLLTKEKNSIYNKNNGDECIFAIFVIRE